MKIVPILIAGKCINRSEGLRTELDFYINEETAWLRKSVSWIVNVVVVLACAWFLVYGFGEQVKVSGNSMQPVLDGGDVVLTDRLSYVIGKPQRFDIVVFEREDGKKNVKRVIGLPGETVQIKNGIVLIDGEPLKAPAQLEQVSLAGRAESPVQLSDGEYFFLGDNRDSSEDSRFANVGNVTLEQISGKVWLRFLPLLKIGFISGKERS